MYIKSFFVAFEDLKDLPLIIHMKGLLPTFAPQGVCSGGVSLAGSPFKGAGPSHPTAVSGLVLRLPTDTDGQMERQGEREADKERDT